MPPHYRTYDEPFLRWLARNRYAVDYLSDAELRTTTGRTLAAGYELMIFPGHHEYVTAPELQAVTGFRNRGGNLAFLSANNFFRKVTIDRGVMTIVGQWRKLGRPEAALIGVQYFSSGPVTSSGRPWIVRGGTASESLFRYTGLVAGSSFGSGGIEADRLAPSSPPGVEVDRRDPARLRGRPQGPDDDLPGSLGRAGVRRRGLLARGLRLAAARAAAPDQPDRGSLSGHAAAGRRCGSGRRLTRRPTAGSSPRSRPA